MNKTVAALCIVASLAWNASAGLAAQPTKVRIPYSSRSNSITPFHLLARPELRRLKDLKGKMLGVSTLFGTDQRAAEEILRAKVC
jgi:hypothetical protein